MPDFPLMKHCPACGFPHGVDYVCLKGIFADDLTYPPPDPMPILPQKAPPLTGATVGYLTIGGKTFPITPGLMASFGNDVVALIAHLKAFAVPSAAPPDVADVFFLAFVEHSDRTPVQLPARAEFLQLLTHFGDTDPRI